MTTTLYYTYFDSPLGRMLIQGDGQLVTGLFMLRRKAWRGPDALWQESDAPFTAVRKQLGEYFDGRRQQFDVPLKLVGTPFQLRVWRALAKIHFGATITYAELARRIGHPSASRAVGQANGCNPISIIVPCHRVIGTSGKLTGYAGGLRAKRWLLDWERCRAARKALSLASLSTRQISQEESWKSSEAVHTFPPRAGRLFHRGSSNRPAN